MRRASARPGLARPSTSRSGTRARVRDPRLAAAVAELRRKGLAPLPTPAWQRGAGPLSLDDLIIVTVSALELTDADNVLDVGTGSGYQAALLGRSAGHVHSIEIDGERANAARETLSELGIDNVEVIRGDGVQGFAPGAPYQAIIVGAATLSVPTALVDQLDVGGRLVIPIGGSEGQLVQRFRKHRDSLVAETITGCALEPLVSPLERPSFFPWMSSISGSVA
jgi:protein-L-isoaspartate(D-aspartate) O-methyltransferase